MVLSALQLNAEEAGDVAEQLNIEAVPTFLFFKVRPG